MLQYNEIPHFLYEMLINQYGDNITKKITNQVLIAENVIVGHIPETFYNLEGLNRDDAMEVMQ